MLTERKRQGLRAFTKGCVSTVQNATHHGPKSSDDAAALSARLAELADRINATNGAQRSDRQPPARPAASTETRIWPQLPRDAHKKALNAKIDAQTGELAERDLQIAELTGVRLALAEDLRNACEQIDRLTTTIEGLRRQADQRDLDLATATHRLIDAENEKSRLQADLRTERDKAAAMAQRLLDVETAFNNRLVDFTANREATERLSRELADAQAEIPKVTAAAEVQAHRLFAYQVAQIRERHAKELQDLQSMLAERKQQTDQVEQAHAELTALFGVLSDKIASLESEKVLAEEFIRTQTSQIELVEMTAAAERHNAEATIKELIAEFGRERERMKAQEKAAAEIRMNIVQLLPKLTARRNATGPATAQVA